MRGAGGRKNLDENARDPIRRKKSEDSERHRAYVRENVLLLHYLHEGLFTNLYNLLICRRATRSSRSRILIAQ